MGRVKLPLPPPVPDGKVVRLLWRAARLRAKGRAQRQAELMRRKKGKAGISPGGCLAVGIGVLMMLVIHTMLGVAVDKARGEARVHSWEQTGRVVVSEPSFYPMDQVRKNLDEAEETLRAERERQARDPGLANPALLAAYEEKWKSVRNHEMERLAYLSRTRSGIREVGESDVAEVREHFEKSGWDGFISEEVAQAKTPPGAPVLSGAGAALLTIYLGWWFLMVVCQGEGLEIDVQRRRHPLWEWLLSHPVKPVAAYAAEMLGPVAANPMYLTAPVFWIAVLWPIHGAGAGIAGGLAIGLPFAVAASALNKSCEVAALLRLSPRTRGAVLGLMSWIGYAAMMAGFFIMQAKGLNGLLLRWLAPVTGWFPAWPVQALTSGWGARPEIGHVIVSGWLLCAGLLAGAVLLSAWGFRQGLQGGSGPARPAHAPAAGTASTRWKPGRALYRKELLWFWRDKSAVVQAVLIPLTIGAFQAFNLRHLASSAVGSWNGLCGLAIVCATYFLLVLGPRSLASEGGALWITLTWPQGLEALLKAKARLWWLLSSILMACVLVAALVLYPDHWWEVGLVAVGWYFFGRSLAEKTVTLVRAPSSGGEPEPASRGRQWMAMLGTLTFASGVMTGTWHTALLGVVFSILAAAAMWQDLRARLPYLYDPWSETLPPAPTLVHAMVAIAITVEAVGFSQALASMASPAVAGLIRFFAYSIVGLAAWALTASFLGGRGVRQSAVWVWRDRVRRAGKSLTDSAGAALTGLAGGAALGGLGLLYLSVLRHVPAMQEWFAAADAQKAADPGAVYWQIPIAVFLVPFAEEYLFRGLLYRALDREWGGRRALIGSAAWFALYHPPVSWLPVFALGVAAAWLFRSRGRLIACVALHAAYNAVVLGLG